MKLLIVDVNGEHMNPMWRNLKNALMYDFDVCWFGPGYVSEQTLELGVKKYIEKKQGFDFIIINIAFYQSAIGTSMGNIYYTYNRHRYFLSKYSVIEMERFGAKIVKQLDECNDIKKIILYADDTATMDNRNFEALREYLEKGYYYLGWGEQFAVKEITTKKFCGDRITLNHKKICEDYYTQIISIPPCAINESNIGYAELEAREYDWIVTGNIKGYPHREKMQQLLEEEHVNLWNEDKLRSEFIYRSSRVENFKKLQYRNWFDRIVANIGADFKNNSIYMPTRVSAEQIGGFRERYVDSLKNVKYAYVDGGSPHFFVAKYVEVPASGAVMIGEIAYGLKEMGFAPGKHMVELPVEKINKKVLTEIQEDTESMQEIACNARKLVVKKHTFRKRAEVFRKVCERIKQGIYKGGYWKDGDFYFEQ